MNIWTADFIRTADAICWTADGLDACDVVTPPAPPASGGGSASRRRRRAPGLIGFAPEPDLPRLHVLLALEEQADILRMQIAFGALVAVRTREPPEQLRARVAVPCRYRLQALEASDCVTASAHVTWSAVDIELAQLLLSWL